MAAPQADFDLLLADERLSTVATKAYIKADQAVAA